MTAQADPILERVQWVLKDPRFVAVAAGLIAAAMAVAMAGQDTIILLLLPVVLVCIAASIKYPLVALWLLVAIMVTNASQNLIVEFGLPSIAKLAAPGMFVLFAARYFILGERPYFGRLAICGLLIVLGMKAVSMIYARDWEVAFDEADGFMRDVLYTILALGFLSHRKSYQTVMSAAPIAVALICALGVYQYIVGYDPGGFRSFALIIEHTGRFTGPLGDANFFGVIIVFAVPLALFHVMNGRAPVEILVWSVISAVLIAGLVATNSRGALVGLAFGLMILALGMTVRQVIGYALLAVVALAIAMMFMGQETIDRFATILGIVSSVSDAGDTSTEGRLASWAVAFSLFRDYPLFGVGVGNFNLHYQDRALELGLIFRGEGRSTHSLYLEFLAEQGLVGLGLVLCILGAAAVSIVSAVKELRRLGEERMARHMTAFGAALGGYLFGMTFLHDSFPRFLWFVIALGLEARFFVAYHYGDARLGRFVRRSQGA